MSDITFPNNPSLNPCHGCGACCRTFRVSFFYGETDMHGGLVPHHKVIPITPFRVAMKGTEDSHMSQCVAYDGGCSIYENRPSPCRSFPVWEEDGTVHEGCAKARAKHGLPPMVTKDVFYQ